MRRKYQLSLSLILAAGSAPALAQLQAGEAPTPEQVAAGEVLSAENIPEEERAARELQAQMAALRWTRPAAQDLLSYVLRVYEEGLDPSDYGPDRLRAALAGTDEVELSTAATDTFLRISSDLALGHVRGDGRLDWHTVDYDLDARQQYELMKQAITSNYVRDTLNSLLPTHPQYAELKGILATTLDQETRDKIRANLDRWRWLPRNLGKRYVIVNVPAYTAAIVEDGRVVARHRVVVGRPKTATPQITATATGVIFNPWWEVPDSIADEVRGKKGYVTVKNGDKVRYRQPPGPSNSLGRMKVVMPNTWAIYLHDTPAKALFENKARAYSHGCIRTQDPITFARLLLNSEEWDKAAIDKVLAGRKTVKAAAALPTPVYIAYFTAAAISNNGGVINYTDIYSRDNKVVLALNEREGVATLASSEKPATGPSSAPAQAQATAGPRSNAARD